MSRSIKKGPFVAPELYKRVYLLLTYKDRPIGFAKNIGNRANNLYPAEWRIRKNPVEL